MKPMGFYLWLDSEVAWAKALTNIAPWARR